MFYSFSDRLVQLSGAPEVSSIIMLSAFLMVSIIPFVSHNLFGLNSIPLSMLISTLILSPLIRRVAELRSGIKISSVGAEIANVGFAMTLLLMALVPVGNLKFAIFSAAFFAAGIIVWWGGLRRGRATY